MPEDLAFRYRYLQGQHVTLRAIVDGQDLRANPDLSRQMAYVFQGPRLLRWKTLAQNAEFGLRGLNVQPKERWPELIEKYFTAVGLREVRLVAARPC